MPFARWVFLIAGVYGVLAIAPMYFLESRFPAEAPPAITHPEFFYGFIGVTLAWQFAFLVIALDPPRYRLLMLPAMFEKFSFTAAATVLMLQGRLPGMVFGFALLDFLLGALFVIAFVKTQPMKPA
jgi:hypothetical protein